MSFRKLISEIQQLPELPITVDWIRSWLLQNNHQDEISLYPVDYNPLILKGQYRQYRSRPGVYADPLYHTEIHFSQNMSLCWQRFVCAKEMMHIFDTPQSRTRSEEAIRQLTFELSSPFHGENCEDYHADHLAQVKAIMALVPEKFLDKYSVKYQNKQISDMQLAEILKIPVFYTSFIFSEEFPAIYDTMLQT